tara:strand:- start:806 stop:1804 length:999 start_codon:yes stop_codon:yes gene_type:complete
MKHFCLSFIIVSLIAFSTYSIAEEGAYFTPDKIGSSARMVRLGGMTGMSEKADSVFDNPASLYRIKNFSSSFFRSTLVDEAVYQNFAVAIRGPIGVIGFGIFSLTVDDIYKTSIDPNDEFTFMIDSMFNYENYLVKSVYQLSLTNYLHVGIGGSFYYSMFDTVEATGMNMDVGLILKLSAIEISVLINNMMSSNSIKYTDTGIYDDDSLSSDGQTESLSLDVLYSVKYMLRHLTMYGQIKQCGENRDLTQTMALQLNPKFLPFIKASVGYSRFPVTNWDEGLLDVTHFSSISTGVELNLYIIDLNYAYKQSFLSESSVFYQQNHYFSLGYSF